MRAAHQDQKEAAMDRDEPGRVADGKLTCEGPARFQYELDDDGRIRVDPDGRISISWWLRDETAHWQPWMTNTFEREDDGS
jgi:hypothetical protein